jgi:transposase
MYASIHFTGPTVKILIDRLQQAYAKADLHLVRRISALLDVAKGERIAQVAEKYAVTRQTIYDWLVAFMTHGSDSLVYRRSPGRKPRLTPEQRKRLVELMKAGPEAAGFGTACWTSLLVQQLIYREFDVLYNRHYICTLLHSLNFSFQKARFESDHLNEAARKEWWATTWPEILHLAQEKGAMILFGDEVSFAQWGSLARTWAPVGQQPVVKTSGKRKGYKVFGLIDLLSGRFFYLGQEERFNSDRYQAFLTQVLEETSQHIIVIQDGARYHTAKATRAWFEAHCDRLTVFQLPSYSPDYNPIEFLWKKMKHRATHNKYFAEFADLVKSVNEGLAYFAEQAAEIQALIGLYVETLKPTMLATA